MEPLARPEETAIGWALRVGIAMEFASHGTLALMANPAWLHFFGVVGIGPELGARIMPAIGVLDWLLAMLVLIRPLRLCLGWMTLWACWTALLRPLSGGSWLGFVERGANIAAPLALLLLRGWPASRRDWLR